MLMVIEERVIGPACLSAGSLVSKAALGGAEEINPRERRPRRERASKTDDAVRRTTKANLQLARFGHTPSVKYAHTTRPSRDRESEAGNIKSADGCVIRAHPMEAVGVIRYRGS